MTTYPGCDPPLPRLWAPAALCTLQGVGSCGVGPSVFPGTGQLHGCGDRILPACDISAAAGGKREERRADRQEVWRLTLVFGSPRLVPSEIQRPGLTEAGLGKGH